MRPAIRKLDKSVLGWVKEWPQSSKPLLTLANWLGEPLIIMPVAITAVIYSLVTNKPHTFWAFSAAIIAVLAIIGLKQFIHRKRPNTLYVKNYGFESYSFPSWHAFSSVVTYGLLAYLASTHLSFWLAYPIVIALMFLTMLVGISRVYFGAHYASDVMGGWLLGTLVLVAIIWAIWLKF